MAKLYTKRDMYLNESVGDRGINLYTRSKVGDAFRWQVDPILRTGKNQVKRGF